MTDTTTAVDAGRDAVGDDGRDAVVVPAIGTGSSLACIRSLGKRGVHTIAASADSSPASAQSKYCGEFQQVASPWNDVDAYARDLLALAERPDVRTLVPLREPDIYVLSKHRDEFAEYVSTPWMDFDGIRGVQDRLRLVDAAREAGVGTPVSGLADDWEHWGETTVVKPRDSLHVEDGTPGYGGVHFFDSGEEPDVDALTAEMNHVPLAQEYVPGSEERGFFALYDHGDPVVTFQHRRIRSYKYAGGASVFRKSVRDPALDDAGQRLLDALDWHGLAMVEFKRDPRDGEYKLMEINPRFWGSLSLPVAAGVDFPYWYYQLATGGVDAAVRPAADASGSAYETGVGCHDLRGEFSYLHSLLAEEYEHTDPPAFLPELYAVGRSVVTDRNFDYLSLDDPGPFRSIFSETGRDATASLRRWFAGVSPSSPSP